MLELELWLKFELFDFIQIAFDSIKTVQEHSKRILDLENGKREFELCLYLADVVDEINSDFIEENKNTWQAKLEPFFR